MNKGALAMATERKGGIMNLAPTPITRGVESAKKGTMVRLAAIPLADGVDAVATGNVTHTDPARAQARLAVAYIAAGVPVDRIIVHRMGGKVIPAVPEARVSQLMATAEGEEAAAARHPAAVDLLSAALSQAPAVTLTGEEVLALLAEYSVGAPTQATPTT